MDVKDYTGKIPLTEYPWNCEINRLIEWAAIKGGYTVPFSFDLAMSLAYLDATSGIEKYIEHCENGPYPYNSHLGFINLCAL